MRNIIMIAAATLVMIVGTSFREHDRTIKNLQKAYQEEAIASRRYQLFSEKAEQDGYGQVAKLFKAAYESKIVLMSNHKKALRELGAQPEAIIKEKIKVGDTKKNLKDAIKEEGKESHYNYPNFIQEARKDMKPEAKLSFEFARSSEETQWMLFKEALHNLGKNEAENYYVNHFTGEVLNVSVKQPRSVTGEDMVRVK